MSHRYLIGALALACLSIPAFAQDTSTQTNPAPGPDASMSSEGGMTMADSATVKLKFGNVKPADVMSSKLVGATVYNNRKDSVGQVEDLVIEKGRTLTGIVVSVGGFLGIGESYVVLDPSSLAVQNKDGKLAVYADTDKETLKNAPKFEYSKKK